VSESRIVGPPPAGHTADIISVNKSFYESYYTHAWKARLQYDPVSKRNLARRVLSRMRFPPESRRILDIGFGSGAILFSFAPDHALYGVELARSAVTDAERRARHLGVREFAFREYAGHAPLPFPGGFFDLVVCSHVLEHVPDDRFLLSEIRRVLRPGRTALLNIPVNEGRYTDPHHLRRYTEAAFQDLVRNAGLNILHAESADRIWNLFGWFFERRIHKKLGPAGFLLSAAVNLYFAAIPDAVARAMDRLLDGTLPACQFIVAARRGEAPG
jgi:SAM-dependent methyltransferase